LGPVAHPLAPHPVGAGHPPLVDQRLEFRSGEGAVLLPPLLANQIPLGLHRSVTLQLGLAAWALAPISANKTGASAQAANASRDSFPTSNYATAEASAFSGTFCRISSSTWSGSIPSASASKLRITRCRSAGT